MKNFKQWIQVIAVAAIMPAAFANQYLFQEGGYVDQEYWFDAPQAIDPTYTGQLSVASQLPGSVVHVFDKFGYDKNNDVVTKIEILFALNNNFIEILFGDADPGDPNVVFEDLDSILNGDQFIHNFTFTGTGLNGSILMNLIDTGILDYTLSLTPDQIEGGVQVDVIAASLAFETYSVQQEQFARVSDTGASLGLLGLGLAGLAGLRRRIARLGDSR